MVKPINDANHYGRIETDKRVAAHPLNPGASLSDESNDVVSFSDVSKQMTALKAAIMNVPDMNAARVAFIKEELNAGRYEISSARIAHKMIADVELS